MAKDPDIKPSKKVNNAKPAKDVKKQAKTKSGAKTKLSSQLKKTGAKISGKGASFQDRLKKLGIEREKNKKKIVTIGVLSLVALAATITIFGVLIYQYKSTDRAVKIASKAVPYPVASVNGNIFWNTVTYNQYLFELASIQKFYQSQGQDLNSDEGKQRLNQIKKEIITQLENNLIIQQQASKYGIKVSNKEIQDQFDELVKNAGGIDKVKSTLDKLYGWNISDFKEKIKQSILQKKLAEKILADEKLNESAKKQAQDIKNQISQGADFAELAKKFSNDSSASNGGDLGLISKGQTVPEFEAAAFKLEPGQVSEVVKTQYGYHIIKVTGKESDKVKVSHILIKSVDLDSWLKDQRAKSKIVQYFNP